MHADASDLARIVLRPVRPADAGPLTDLFDRLRPVTRYHRFVTARPATAAHAAAVATADGYGTGAVVALVEERVVGVAEWTRAPRSDLADVHAVVDDAWQRRGVGTDLLNRLARRARRAGIRSFESITLADNDAALRSLRRLGPTQCVSMGPHVRLRTRLPRTWRRPMDLRQVRRFRTPRRNRGSDAVPSGTVVVTSTRT
jgi:RimJ/RimL family protein N-acetyltransferase